IGSGPAGAQRAAGRKEIRREALSSGNLHGLVRLRDRGIERRPRHLRFGLRFQSKKWFQNADDIAALLAGANPNWPQKTLQDMLHSHLQMVTEQVVALLKHDTASLIAAYDRNSEHMMMLADALASGIVKQFPDKFR